MRLKITLNAPKLPILYRHRIIALIKEALGRSDRTYKEYLYPEKKTSHSKRVKPFTFALSLPSRKTIKKEGIALDEDIEIEDTVFYFPTNTQVSLFISSSDYQFIVNLYNGLLDIKEFKFNDDITLKLNRVYMLNEKKITEDKVTFKTNAPILIENRNGKPLLPMTNTVNLPEYFTIQPSAFSLQPFNNHFNAIHDRILKDIRGKGLYKTMEFEPLKLKKQVVKHTLKGFRERTGKPYMTLTCFEGCFNLKGDPRDLQLLYQIGIGLRTGQGFGMVEIV